MPLADQGLVLSKQEFRDALNLRYNLPLVDLTSLRECGDKFTVGPPNSLIKRAGFVGQRQDGVRYLLTTFINKICNNMKIKTTPSTPRDNI